MIQIELMTLSTAAAVAEIEAACFSVPWSEKAFLAELSNPAAVTWVAKSGDNIAGFLNLSFVMDEASINNIAVKEDFRRQGIAKKLLTTAICYCQKHHLLLLMLEVRKSNCAAIALYEQFGFEKVGIRKHFYDQPDEDAVLMNKAISSWQSAPEC